MRLPDDCWKEGKFIFMRLDGKEAPLMEWIRKGPNDEKTVRRRVWHRWRGEILMSWRDIVFAKPHTQPRVRRVERPSVPSDERSRALMAAWTPAQQQRRKL